MYEPALYELLNVKSSAQAAGPAALRLDAAAAGLGWDSVTPVFGAALEEKQGRRPVKWKAFNQKVIIISLSVGYVEVLYEGLKDTASGRPFTACTTSKLGVFLQRSHRCFVGHSWQPGQELLRIRSRAAEFRRKGGTNVKSSSESADGKFVNDFAYAKKKGRGVDRKFLQPWAAAARASHLAETRAHLNASAGSWSQGLGSGLWDLSSSSARLCSGCCFLTSGAVTDVSCMNFVVSISLWRAVVKAGKKTNRCSELFCVPVAAEAACCSELASPE
ncbi:hypothetical protein Anapl_17806 [Anas platyrhynchos]|uniref:Uncharacterized protein n=1 Tax=Anas platyrhynchos TaxID=8839 RepID=R0J7T0_ANAPL|nr:hypothetical protein Anapl_17806 [Anas platyrhynchos]